MNPSLSAVLSHTQSNPDNRRRLVASVGTQLVGGVSILVLVGWVCGIGFLQTLIPGSVPMNPLTAICVLLCAVALRRITAKDSDRVAFALALAISVVALFRLADYLFHSNIELDQLLFRTGLVRGVPGSATQMVPNTAFCILLTGLSFLGISETPWRQTLTRICCLVNIAICWLIIVGYILTAIPIFRVGTFNPMALPEAICLLLIALLTLAIGSKEEIIPIFFDDTLGSLSMRVTVPMAFIVPLLVVFLSDWGYRSGLYAANTGAALTASLITAITLAIVIPMSSFMNKLDKERREHQQLLESHDLLLADLSAIDGLTGVLNRRSFDEILSGHLERAKTGEYRISLILIDLDHFKRYNEDRGTPAGDERLRQVGKMLKGSIRSDDEAARFGADEFALILPRATSKVASEIAGRVLRSITQFGDGSQDSSASIGVVTVDHTFEGDIVNATELCLQKAKAQGGNTFFTLNLGN